MAKVSVKLLVEGGKVSAGPPLGPSLAVYKVGIQEVVAEINEKTKEFAGISVPVEVAVDTETKQFDIKVGTPSVSQLIKKELKAEKLAKASWKEPAAGNLSFEQVVKIANLKLDSLGTSNIKLAVKEVTATCLSCGVTVDSKNPKDILKEINDGKWDTQLQSIK